jgi:SAM-dependent methyltransferase
MDASIPGTSRPTSVGLSFDDLYTRIVSSAVVGEIWKTAFGSDYPEEASPFSFVSLSDLTALHRALSLGPTHRFVDLGCGCGGPGLFLARRSGASLVGVDSSSVAVAQSIALAGRLNLQARATYQLADAAATALAAHTFDGALCIDMLQMTPQPTAVLREIGRLLRPGSKLGLTTWTMSEPWRGRPAVLDYRPLLEATGFEVLSQDEPESWKQRQLAVYELIRNRRSELVSDLGAEAAGLLLDEAESAPEALEKSQRVRIVAQLRDRVLPAG